MARSEKIFEGNASLSGAIASEELTKNLSEATRRVFRDSNELNKVIEQYKNASLHTRQGRAFEFLETLKFNKAAAEQNRSDLEAHTTHSIDPHSPKDIIIEKNGKEVLGVQAKSIENTAQAIRAQSDEKYTDLGRLIPSDQYDDFKRILDKRLENAPQGQIYAGQYEDVQKNLMNSLQKEGVKSEGTTRAENEFASLHPDIAQFMYNGDAIINEVGTGMAYGTSISGGIAVVSQGIMAASQVINGKKDLSKAVTETVAITASAAARGAVVSGVAKGIGIAAKSEGLKSFGESVGPIAISNTLFEMGKAINGYVKGNINKAELKEKCGAAAIRGTSTYYCGIVGQVLIPVPVLGGLVGSIVGYTTSAMLVNAGLLGAGPNNIVFRARKRRKYIEKQAIEAIKQMEIFRNQFEQMNHYYAQQYSTQLLPAISIIDDSLVTGNFHSAIKGLAYINDVFANDIKFRTFDEFDEFMKDNKSELKL